MTTLRLLRLRWGLVLFAFLATGLSQAQAQDTGLARGDAVVTGFSGIKPLDVPVPPGADPLDYFFIDTQGPSAEILSLSSLGEGPHGQLAPAPVKRQFTAGEVGQVFAVTLDDGLGQPVPNVYLGATSAYGIQIVGPDTDGDGFPNRLKKGAPGAQFMAGQFGPAPGGNPGTIWRVDGTSGAVSAFTSLPGNSGPGVGGVVFDQAHRQFFASDLDNGLIYRISADGQVLDNFDHGLNGRPAHGMAPLADDGKVMDITSPLFDSENPASWGYTQKDRMVWGMAVHNGRLYYAVAGGLQVWSIGIADNGDFAGDPRWELDATALPGDGPITDMLFDGQGRMVLAQRGAPRGSYDYSVFAESGKSSVVRYHLKTPNDPPTPSVWAPDADEYAIGMRPEFRQADGGIALGYAHDPETGMLQPGSCNMTLWSTGSRLRSSENPDMPDQGTGPADVHGLQGNDAALVRPQNVPPTQAYYIDYDGLLGDAQNAGHMGDVAIWQPCSGEGFEIRGELPPGFYPPGIIPPGFPPRFPPPRGHWHTNLRLTKHVRGPCVPRGAGWACRYVIQIRNTGPDPYFGPLLINDHLPGTPPGALMGFAPTPPWACWNTGPASYNCWRPASFLPAGASRYLLVVVWVPNAYVLRNHCSLRNVASITWAPGGSQWNTNPADDSDGATATIPAPECRPEPQRTNLKLEKFADPGTCAVLSATTLRCGYRVVVTNTGPGVYDGLIRVFDQPQPGTAASFGPAPWACVASGGGYECTHPLVHLIPGQTVVLRATVTVLNAQQGNGQCTVTNRARITFAPGGSPQNVNPGDDAASATAQVPPSFCTPVLRSVQPPPPPPPPPPVMVPPPTRLCPQGTVRRGDRCVPIVRECPRGTVRRGGRCVPIVRTCPRGTVRRGDRCVPIVRQCPQGTVLRRGRCVPILRVPPPTNRIGPPIRRLQPTPQTIIR